MKCRYCGNELRSEERFCRRCGKPVETEPVQSSRFCSECGAELLPNAGFCRSCGAPVSQQKPEQPQQPNAAQTDEKAELKRRTEILVIAAQGGDSESFAKLYELYHQKVFALAKTTVKSDADAEDVLQMTFIKAWDHLDRLKDTSAFSTWIQRITLNQCYSLLRKQHATIPIDNDDEDSEPIQIESDLMLPEVYAEQNDLKKRLGKIIDELSDVQKQTITLYYFDGLPVENIAWIMDCSVNTVKSRLFLARKSIKTEIEEQERKSGQPFYGIVGLATIPFGQFFVAHVKASSLSQTAASALLKAIAGKISQSASAAAKAGSSAAVKAGTSAAAKGAANAGAKTAAAAGTKAAAGAGAKTAAAVGASVSKKVIAGIVAGTLAVGTVAGGTVATVKIVQNNRERKAAESATTVVTDGTFPSVTASDPFLPQDPSDGLSAQEREAYQAYLEHLEQNKPGIDGYKNVFDYSDDDSTDPENYPMPRAVALFDVCEDAIPELIYINEGRKDAQFGTIYNLNVLTYRDGSLVSVYRDEWDYNSYWDEMITYYLFADPTSKTMYFFEDSSMSNYVLKEYSAFTETESGHLQRSKIMFYEEEYDEDSEKTTVVYNVNGRTVSEADFRKEVERLQANAVYLIPRPGEFREPENAQYIAMTCDEMIAYLQGLLNASTGTTEQPAATSYADAYAAYIDYLIAHKEGIDRYIWQLDDWYYFYQEDEITGGLTPWQSDTWRYYYGEDGPQAITTPQTPRPVVFYNIYGDAIPELIFIEVTDPDISYSTESTLNILTYQNGQLVSLYSGKWDCPDTDEWRMELTLSVRQDGTLYRYEENGSTFDGEDQYDVYTVNTDGRFTRELALRFTLHEEDEEFPPPPTKEYYGRSNQIISETEYEELKKAFDHSTRLFGWSGNGELAMTADEAIAWLQSQLGMTAEAPVTPSPTAEPTPSDVGATSKPEDISSDIARNAYQAYIVYLSEKKTALDAYTWQKSLMEEDTPEAEQLSRPVAVRDIDGDGIFELLLCLPNEPIEPYGDIRLSIVDWINGAVRTVYTDNDEHVFCVGENDYTYCQIQGEDTLYLLYQYGDVDDGIIQTVNEWYRYSAANDGTYQINSITERQAPSESQIKVRLMSSLPDSSDSAAMTCDEAIAWLKSQLGTESETPTAVPREVVTPTPTQATPALTDFGADINDDELLKIPELEPKETYAQNATILSWSGKFAKKDQLDTYSFTAERDGIYSFFFTDILEGQKYPIQVINASGNTIHNEKGYYEYGLGSGFCLELKSGETYTLRTAQRNSYYGGYTINVGVQKEYIDVDSYTDVYDSIEFPLQQNAYRMVPTVTGEYRFCVSGLPEGYACGIQVLNPAGTPIANDKWYISFANREGLYVNLTAGQTYLIKVREAGYYGPYCFEVGLYKRSADISAALAVDDSIQFLNQRNMYTFIPEQTAPYEFGFSEIPEGYSYQVQVLNPAGKPITNDRWYLSYSNGQWQSVNLTAGQRYTVIVRPSDKLFGKYRFDIGTYCKRGEIHENNRVNDSFRYRLQKNLYTFTPKTDGDYEIELSGMPVGYSYLIQVWNVAGDVISNDRWFFSYRSGESQKVNLVGGQTYTIIIRQNQNFLGDYTVSIHR